jgi:hypothetical protein
LASSATIRLNCSPSGYTDIDRPEVGNIHPRILDHFSFRLQIDPKVFFSISIVNFVFDGTSSPCVDIREERGKKRNFWQISLRL